MSPTQYEQALKTVPTGWELAIPWRFATRNEATRCAETEKKGKRCLEPVLLTLPPHLPRDTKFTSDYETKVIKRGGNNDAHYLVVGRQQEAPE